MDARFDRVWARMRAECKETNDLAGVIRATSDRDLVAALASSSAANDSVAANAIATELLNRLHRAPFLGSFLVGTTTFVLIYVLDLVYTGTFLFLESGWRAQILVAFSLVVAAASGLSWRLWRGRSHTRLFRGKGGTF